MSRTAETAIVVLIAALLCFLELVALQSAYRGIPAWWPKILTWGGPR